MYDKAMLKTKLLQYLILLFCIAAYATGDASSCDHLLPSEAMKSLGEQGTLFPDRDQLASICPGFLSFTSCFKKALEDRPDDFDEDNRFIFRSIEGSFRDLCSADSDIKQKYFLKVDCLKSVEPTEQTCMDQSRKIYQNYKSSEENSETPSIEPDCFRQVFVTGCMSDNILNICGKEALDVYQHFMHGQITAACRTSTAEDLKTKFLDYLRSENDENTEDALSSTT